MHWFWTLSAWLFVVSLLPAQGKAILPSQEAADGWLLLFDGKTPFGWTVQGDVKVEDGTLVLGGKNETTARFNTALPGPVEVTFEMKGRGQASLRDQSNTHQGEAWTKIHWQWNDVRKGPSPYLEVKSAKGFPVILRNVKARPLQMKSIFNGKDLTGWNIFPGKKSKIVVQDGAINLQDGPGDLQTEGKYQNFLLQLDCVSHGKHLNSGVFFRCRPNEYQNGYEAQIRNQFTEEPTQEYTVDVYDPKTHELIEKKKVKSTAFDFGTGAIYRRVPSRFQASKDGEWFTLTVVADGNHLATWVNGLQQVDWYDNRPKSDNARTGCKLEAGHISLQGHDPTTNLSFKNFRIQELP